MRPGKAIADHSDRGLNLKELWAQLKEDPPGEPKSLDGNESPKDQDSETAAASTANQ